MVFLLKFGATPPPPSAIPKPLADILKQSAVKKMKFKILLIFSLTINISAFAQKNVLIPYIEFIQKNKFPSAKDYILEKFKTKDIVIISERDHRDITQYELYIAVIKDTNFRGNIYTEVGSWNNYKRINKFLLNSNLSESAKEKELLAIYRNLDYTILWEKYNYYFLLSSIFEINKSRNEKDKILLFPLDLEFDWEKIDCHSQYKLVDEYSENSIVDRNIIMGKNFVYFYELAKKRNPERTKALVIENTYHGYIRIPKFIPLPTQPDIYSTGEYIFKTYPEYTTNIYINYFTQGFQNGLSNNGLFDAAFYFTKTDNIGFDLKNSPFGNSKFDLYNFGGDYEKVNFDYVFDGMIFYKPVAEMNLVTGIPNVYPKEFEKQFYERLALINGISYDKCLSDNKELLKELNTKNEVKLPDSIIRKINAQIEHWIK